MAGAIALVLRSNIALILYTNITLGLDDNIALNARLLDMKVLLFLG